MPAVSKSQQRLFGIVRAVQKGEMAATTPEVAKLAATMKKKDVKDFASTKHDGLPKKKKTLKEFMGFFKKKKPPEPKDVKVLAYKNYKPGVLNKTTGEFTQRDHTPDEAKRYGWKPVKTSSYGPRDTTSQAYNTGKDNVQRTADGTAFSGSTRGVAVPYKYKAGEVPKGTWAGTPSVKFGTNVQFTQKPMGKDTRVTNAKVRDTGNFGAAGEFNRSTSFDLMRQTARDVTGNKNLTPTQYGKRTLYSRIKDSK
jgi:hypothetical protein